MSRCRKIEEECREMMKNDKRRKAGRQALLLWMVLALSAAGLSGCGKTGEDTGQESQTMQKEDTDSRGTDISDSGLGEAEMEIMDPEEEKGIKVISPEGSEAYYDGHTTVVLDGMEYDIADRSEWVNGISDICALDGYWLVEGHISPDISYYGFYNRETLQWDKEVLGAGLTWYGEDEGGRVTPFSTTAASSDGILFSLDSIVYTVGDEVYDSDGNLIQKVELDAEEGEYIYGLERKDTSVEVCIVNDAVEKRYVSVKMPLPDKG